jgi:undecaprenyl-diphosphatase
MVWDMTVLNAIILGIIEGVTEFLPVSSTGHLMLAQNFLGISTSEFSKSFQVAIQLGAIGAVVWLYWRVLCTDREMMKRIAVAFIPTGVAGFLLYPIIKNNFLANIPLTLFALGLGGAFLLLFEWRYAAMQKHKEVVMTISYPAAFFIGAFQAFGLVPGISRSAATIIGGMFLGIERKTIVEFSFLLAVPTIAAATAFDLWKHAGSFSGSDIEALSAGFIVSFAVAFAAIRFLISFVRHHTFVLFGAYRILLALMFWFVFF